MEVRGENRYPRYKESDPFECGRQLREDNFEPDQLSRLIYGLFSKSNLEENPQLRAQFKETIRSATERYWPK